jgi:hypothetical protein
MTLNACDLSRGSAEIQSSETLRREEEVPGFRLNNDLAPKSEGGSIPLEASLQGFS